MSNDTQTMTLTEFLTARLDEDEALAKKAAHLKVAGPLIGWRSDSMFLTTMNPGLDRHERTHIARHDPARVLAEVAAKRAIAGLHELTPYYGLDRWGRWLPHEGKPKAWYCDCQTDDGMIGGEAPCPTLRILAAVYADHPDYREEWKP